MKFIVDENLPPRLAVWLGARGHDAAHVRERDLLGGSDSAIASIAQREGRIIVTQDSDFDLIASNESGIVLRIACGNMATASLLMWLEQRWDSAETALLAGERCVILE